METQGVQDMTTAQAKRQIRESGLNPNEINMRLSKHGTAGRLMAERNKMNRRFATSHTFTMSFTCGHKSIIHVAADDEGRQEVHNSCEYCQTFRIFRA